MSTIKWSLGTDIRNYNAFLSKIQTVAAICFPESLKKIQAELDNVVGRDRMPTFDDERSLPYLVAYIKEVTRCVLSYLNMLPALTPMIKHSRWRPVAPLGIPHATTKADMYDGYDIPKGATVYSNIEYVLTPFWPKTPSHLTPSSHSVLVKDPNLFDDPEKFNPSRFLTPHKPAGNWTGKVESDFIIPFGFGRRVCPGMHVALQSTFISMARCVPGSTILLTLLTNRTFVH